MQSVRVRWFHSFPKPLRYARHTHPNKPLAQNPQEKWQKGGYHYECESNLMPDPIGACSLTPSSHL